MKKQIWIVGLLLGVLVPNFSFAETTEDILIVHTDALKAKVLPKEKDGVSSGGFALLSGAVKNIREMNADKGIVLLDAGSSLTGTPFSFYTQGIALISMMNAIGYDAMAIGNREFDNAFSIVKEQEKTAKFAFLSANIKNAKGGADPFKNYIIKKTKAGTNIAIIGLSDEETPVRALRSNIEGLNFIKAEEALDVLLPVLKKKADIIILLSSLRTARDQEISVKYKNDINLIVDRSADDNYLSAPMNVGGCDIVVTRGQTYSIGQYLMHFVKGKGIVSTEWKNSVVDSKAYKPDSDMATLIAKYSDKLKTILSEKIGTASAEIPFVEKQEAPASNLVADILLKRTKADIAFYNIGGIRTGLGKTITKEDVYNMIPFQNVICTLKLKGSDILTLLERSVTFFKQPLAPGGLKYSYLDSLPEMHRITSVTVGNKPLNPNTVYTVATNDFLADGGDGYEEFRKGTQLTYFEDVRTALENYIRSSAPISAGIDGRFTLEKKS